jgi:hypothetical protein
LAVVSEAGAGKSTVLKQILSRRASSLLPIWVPIAELPHDGMLTPASWIGHLVAQAHDKLGLRDVNAEFFESVLDVGAAVIGFDALDEAGDLPRREQVRNLVFQITDRWPGNTFVLTSRPAQYAQTPLVRDRTVSGAKPVEFQVWRIEPFGADDIRDFLRQCFADDGTLARRISERPDVAALTTTPLLLSLLARHARHGQLPADRTDLFANIVRTVCETWEGAKGQRVESAIAEHRSRSLRMLGWAMQVRHDMAAPMAMSDARRAVLEPGTSPDAAKRMIEWLTRNSALLTAWTDGDTQRDPTLLRFKHFQFQEYLAGAQFAFRFEYDRDALLTDFQNRWFLNEWTEPLAFAVGQLAADGDMHNTLLRYIKNMNARHDDLLHRRLLLVSVLLSRTAQADDALVVWAAESLCEVWRDDPASDYRYVDRLRGLARHPAALPTIEQIVLLKPIPNPQTYLLTYGHGDPAAWHELMHRFSLIDAVGQAYSTELALKWLDAFDCLLGDVGVLCELALLRYRFGQSQVAARQLAGAFRGAAMLLERTKLVALLDKIGAAESATTLMSELLATDDNPDLETTMWYWRRGLIDVTSEFIERHVKSGLEGLENEKTEGYVSSEVMEVFNAGFELYAATPTPLLKTVLRATLQHADLVWYYGQRVRELCPGLADEALYAMVALATDPQLTDNSRRRVMALSICNGNDDSREVPALLEMLRHVPTLRWCGNEIIQSLDRRGRALDALAELRKHVVAAEVKYNLCGLALQRAEELQPGVTLGWLEERFNPGHELSGVAAQLAAEWESSHVYEQARPWFEVMAKTQDGRTFLQDLCRQKQAENISSMACDALNGRTPGGYEITNRPPRMTQAPRSLDELEQEFEQAKHQYFKELNTFERGLERFGSPWGDYPPGGENRRPVAVALRSMASAGYADVARRHAINLVSQVSQFVNKKNEAVALQDLLPQLFDVDIWDDSWTDLLADLARSLPPQGRKTLLNVLSRVV